MKSINRYLFITAIIIAIIFGIIGGGYLLPTLALPTPISMAEKVVVGLIFLSGSTFLSIIIYSIVISLAALTAAIHRYVTKDEFRCDHIMDEGHLVVPCGVAGFLLILLICYGVGWVCTLFL